MTALLALDSKVLRSYDRLYQDSGGWSPDYHCGRPGFSPRKWYSGFRPSTSVFPLSVSLHPCSIFIRNRSPWSRVLLEKLTSSQMVKNFPYFMEPEGSLPHSPVPATCPYAQPARSSPYQHIPIN